MSRIITRHAEGGRGRPTLHTSVPMWLPVSRPDEPRCYENDRAERLDGILKQEYGLGCSFRNRKQALKAVFLYNTRRPHPALNCETPESMRRRVA
ncbi:MAG: hypothetical protein LBO04_07085 [Spirochaetaceae bacterium]|nr:hypothetical protein [Spirochaetaceae bacterium]